MLKKEAVSSALLETLSGLMGVKSLKNYRLVEGTALALQMGHRVSVDIDLFSTETNNYPLIARDLSKKFGKKFEKARFLQSIHGKGLAVFINGIKTDILDWRSPFIRKPILLGGIRMSHKEDIIPMKFNAFLCSPEYARYEKKDYIDIAFLLKEYSLQ